MTVKFKEIEFTSKFKYYKEGEKINDYDFWIKLDEFELPEEKRDINFSTSHSKISLAKKYLKKQGIKSKAKKRTLINILKKSQ